MKAPEEKGLILMPTRLRIPDYLSYVLPKCSMASQACAVPAWPFTLF